MINKNNLDFIRASGVFSVSIEVTDGITSIEARHHRKTRRHRKNWIAYENLFDC
ncbi:hypothetical protein EDD55_10781 [Varunaivibrio sulfuroxidans]|uniref:Uncharacterized protein n=1 Tax=Varunaivibrio sulfuroxidans TaxID=1773489 RepID=A0A4R3J879_9PROT|nr:hypothetical protein EDD55_10781 [Varunaivibrio sulfuroxidans]